ncbi:helix-turn-helix domain-containing protein [Paraburkholderia sp.]|uniref:helix-turn-helix domain-containing protein n=1 Tax=Paraburkholderia sp. TaxID=1926495 RepID=UPI00239D871C|nr:helix-turn-helix domain-containing protein [Paraburkholderia sp.]MDE1180010.1 helix-turn-helix domain-containing protein [Paraburkholderia sp.]
MKSWHFSTQKSTSHERPYVWQEAMDAVCLPMSPTAIDDSFEGDVVGLVSPTGIEFSRVRATPLTISGCYRNQQAALWLALLLDGQSVFQGAGTRVEVSRGDMLYGPSGRDSTLELPADFRLLYVRVPLTLLHPGLVDPQMLDCGLLPAKAGLTRVLSGMLRAVGDDLEDFDASDIHPVEVALSEFLVASLSNAHATRRFGDRTRAAHFLRICQSIDQQLGDAELSLTRVTEQQRVSSRYLQKLFEDAGLSFTTYLRDRRLERCRQDLMSPAHRSLSVSEICFRWGFNDAAHFSRSFRAKYDMTARECRAMTGVIARVESAHELSA